MRPTICRLIHVVVSDGGRSVCRPAVVTEVSPPGPVDIVSAVVMGSPMHPLEPLRMQEIRYSERRGALGCEDGRTSPDNELGTWHWPPRSGA